MYFERMNTGDARALALPDVSDVRSFSDAHLIATIDQATAGRRQFDAVLLELTAELNRRSTRDQGQNGLATRLGAKNVEQAIQTLTGASRSEAKALTAVAGAVSGSKPWLAAVATSVSGGDLSVAAAAAIASGLGAPSADVSSDDLQDAADALVEAAHSPGVTPEALATTARQARERLEADRVADIEEHRRSRRSLTWFQRPDGMTAMTGLLDPESAAIITTAIDTVLSPRRGGPRFIDPTDPAQVAADEGDRRTSEQLNVDTLVDIVKLATRAANSEADPERIFGVRNPGVRIHISVDSLVTGVGAGWIEGQTAAISANTAAREVCTSGMLPILFEGAQPIDVGNTRRLHSVRQRIALAAYWGGCAWHGCSRPPAMTEIHHASAFNGCNTTLANGIPLCRLHHMQLHNGGWRIEVRYGPAGEADASPQYWLIPPVDNPRGAGPTRLRPRRPSLTCNPASAHTTAP